MRLLFFSGAVLLVPLFFTGCDTDRLQAENDHLRKEVQAMESEKVKLQSEFNRLSAERDEQRKLRRDFELENKKLKSRLKRFEGK